MAWLAVFENNTGATRTLIFLAWFFAGVTFFAFNVQEIRLKARSKGRTMPKALCVSTGYAFILFFVWFGWWGTAVALLINEMFTQGIYDGEEAA